MFLRNGARLYLDVGSHPEYATPECDSVHELIVHDKAGERILEQLLTFAGHERQHALHVRPPACTAEVAYGSVGWAFRGHAAILPLAFMNFLGESRFAARGRGSPHCGSLRWRWLG